MYTYKQHNSIISRNQVFNQNNSRKLKQLQPNQLFNYEETLYYIREGEKFIKHLGSQASQHIKVKKTRNYKK